MFFSYVDKQTHGEKAEALSFGFKIPINPLILDGT